MLKFLLISLNKYSKLYSYEKIYPNTFMCFSNGIM